MTRSYLPTGARNPLSLVGIAIAIAMAMLFAVLVLLETLGYLTNPYLGLIVFVTIPVVFVLSLLLVAFGAWRTRRRLRRSPGAEADWPVIDLRNPRHRSVAMGVFALTVASLSIVSMAAYGGVHYMESTEFCGQACHTAMEPQAVAHRVWPHAEVACAECHVGPGAGAFMEAKWAGTRQLFRVVTDTVPRPILPPERLLRSSAFTCTQCHTAGSQRGASVRIIRGYDSDEANSEMLTTLQLHVGSPDTPGIHRHIGIDIHYVPADAPDDPFPYVRAEWPDGTVREFLADGVTPAEVADETRRRMECIDCHNRPAHTFSPSPERAIDRALAGLALPRDLPFARREAIVAVSAEYPDRAAALAEIARRMNLFYASTPGADPQSIERAVTATQDVWTQNVFPAMNVTWDTYRNHLGHLDSPGCFRCHTDTHTAADGAVIRQDCQLCHTLE